MGSRGIEGRQVQATVGHRHRCRPYRRQVAVDFTPPLTGAGTDGPGIQSELALRREKRADGYRAGAGLSGDWSTRT
ncbi:hypothetical protein ACHAWF_016817 [Thalassiosira exigua]